MGKMTKEEKHNINLGRWNFLGNLTKEERSTMGCKGRGFGWYECKTCGRRKSTRNGNFRGTIMLCENGCYGVRRPGSKVVTMDNCIGTTHPHLVKYFVEEESLSNYSSGSGEKVLCKCPDCGYEKRMAIKKLTARGFSCPSCSDGIPYPEKFISNLLRECGSEFSSQFSLDSGVHRYDFYIRSKKMIIEVHGGQHYEGGGSFSSVGGRTLQEEQENDQFKMSLALRHGIEHYVVIDARESELGWMKKSIMESTLPELLGFSEDSINWGSIEDRSRHSIVKEVCSHYMSNGSSLLELQREFHVGRGAVIRYLKQGAKLGWCNYDPKEVMKETGRKNGLATGKPIRGTRGTEVVILPSLSSAERWLKEQGKSGNVGACCRGVTSTAGGYHWEYISKEEYEECTVS